MRGRATRVDLDAVAKIPLTDPVDVWPASSGRPSPLGRRISRICRLTTSTTASDRDRSTLMEKTSRPLSTKPRSLRSPTVKDSSGLPRYGGSKASFSVRLVTSLDRIWRASRKLLLPAALGPNSRVRVKAAPSDRTGTRTPRCESASACSASPATAGTERCRTRCAFSSTRTGERRPGAPSWLSCPPILVER